MVEQREVVSGAVQVAWTGLVSEGIANAIRGLSEMVGTEMMVTTLDPRLVEFKEGLKGTASELMAGDETGKRD